MDAEGFGALLPFLFIASIFVTFYLVRAYFEEGTSCASALTGIIAFMVLFLPVMIGLTYVLTYLWVLITEGPGELIRQLF